MNRLSFDNRVQIDTVRGDEKTVKIKICILTATRAEYGLLSPIIHALKACSEFEVKIVVTGAHLSPEFGLTYQAVSYTHLLV